ncbi:MAG: DUF3037 domain-containing protein [Corynebacteriales bacterium]|nr:DUF3037 domain-containing protein [Mycobacteriales bacterium]
MNQMYEYASIKVVPSLLRGECMNIGVLLYCQQASFLGARTYINAERLRALDSTVDIHDLDRALASWERSCEGAGPTADLSPGQRFRWLTAPSSTIVQPGPVHTGLTQDPGAELERLWRVLVR